MYIFYVVGRKLSKMNSELTTTIKKNAVYIAIVLIKAAERETRGPNTSTGICLSPNRGFMDDMLITTETPKHL